MFISEKELIRKAKDAYKKGGLTFGRQSIGYKSGYFFTDLYWYAWIDASLATNKTLALIMELAGILPDDGECFKVSKDEPDPQCYINGTIIKIISEAVLATQDITITGLILNTMNGPLRILQLDTTKQIVGVNDEYVSMISFKELSGKEDMPTGPVQEAGMTAYPVYWYNNSCIFCVMPMRREVTPLIEALQRVDFKKENRIDGGWETRSGVDDDGEIIDED